MEMREWDIFKDLIETGLSRDIVVWARLGMLPENGNAARDFLTRYSSTDPDRLRIGNPGEVQTIELDRANILAGRPNPSLHIISTHRGIEWEEASMAIMTWMERIQQIISARGTDNYGIEALKSLMKSMDIDALTHEDVELLRIFWEAALGPIVASVLIGAWSKRRWEQVPLRALLAAMSGSKLWDNLKVILREKSEPSLIHSGLIPAPKNLISSAARGKVLRVLKHGMPA